MSYTLAEAAESYLRAKRRRLAASSYREYERVVGKLVADLGCGTEVADLEPPAGTETIERFMDDRWGAAPHAYNRNMSVVRGLFRHLIQRERMQRDPTAPIERARPERHARTTFDHDQTAAIMSAARGPRDRIALRLLLTYGLRKGALSGIQLVCFDRARRAVSFRTKGGRYHSVPIAGDALWLDLDELGGHAGDYLLHRRGNPREPMSPHGVHLWWYARLADAGVVESGVTSGQRMHKARHTAGQRVLDGTGNLKAAQRLLGHASIQTTGDVYTEWDSENLRGTMESLEEDEETCRSDSRETEAAPASG